MKVEYSNLGSMDKIWNPQSWPRPLLKGISLADHSRSFQVLVEPFAYPAKFIQYMICVWQSHKISLGTLQLALSIASRFSRKNIKFSESTQLILLVSLLMASKTLDKDNIPVSMIHQISNHSFTNKDIYRTEQRILVELDFNLLEQSICDFHVISLLKMVEHLTQTKVYDLLYQVCQDIQAIIWFSLYTCPDKIPAKCLNMLPAAVVQIGLTLATHCTGRFPATVWMIHIFGLKEDDFNNFVEMLMKILLGKDKMEELQL